MQPNDRSNVQATGLHVSKPRKGKCGNCGKWTGRFPSIGAVYRYGRQTTAGAMRWVPGCYCGYGCAKAKDAKLELGIL
jgi:hypothetical protein